MNQREIQFLIALKNLLDVHGVELEAEDHYPGYPECGEDIRIAATADSRLDFNGDRHAINIDFGGRYVDNSTIKRLFEAGK